MKEATGELNMTLIVFISVGILAAFFFKFLWPMIDHNYQSQSQCKNATCDCSNAKDNDYMCKCKIYKKNKDGTVTEIDGVECPFGG